MPKIQKIIAREILDSRDDPTVEADVFLEDGSIGRASVPSGKSTGVNEACELRDGSTPLATSSDKERYGGKGVLKAVENVNTRIAEVLIGMEANDQRGVDGRMIELDGSENKKNLGANAILAVSLACARASAISKNIPFFEHIRSLSKVPKEVCLPVPLCNILNGGAHTNWQSTDIQEFMIAPLGTKSFKEAMMMLTEIFDSLKIILEKRGLATTVGDEGGFAPALKSNREALELICEAVEKAGYKNGSDIFLALDVATSSMFDENSGKYKFKIEGKEFDQDGLLEFYENLIKDFPIFSIEDGFAENDWSGWQKMTEKFGEKLQLVGDDLLVTNVKFLQKAIDEKAGNAILVKPNQIGTLSETIEAVDLAHQNGWRTIISHRSGETEDTSIAHIAVGLGTGQIKTGSVNRSERMAKYNELLRISEDDEALALAHPFAQS
jgi:enolase